MKYLVINDEHELYRNMYADLFRTDQYDIEEIPWFEPVPGPLNLVRDLHFSERVNRHLWLPLKGAWNSTYALSDYPFDSQERYWVIILNGTLRTHYSDGFFEKLRRTHPNVRVAMVLYDSSCNPSSSRAFRMSDEFDAVFSFDEGDCARYGFEHIWSTLSYPDFVRKDPEMASDAFFVGTADGRCEILTESLSRVASVLSSCHFEVVGVPPSSRVESTVIEYGPGMSYTRALQYSYNSGCLVEVVRPGQVGVTLRTCEAIMFNKKLLTNNASLKSMPFYNPEYMSIFKSPDEIDESFLLADMDVDYQYDGCFSPIRIVKRLEELTC